MGGFGDSPVSQEPFLHVDDLLTVIDHRAGTEPVVLVGSSMVGQNAVDTAL